MPLFETEFRAMGGPGHLQVDAPDEPTAQRWMKAAIDEIDRLEIKYSRYRADSLLSRINAAAGGPALEVDEETVALLDYADELYRQSRGRFDITSGVWRRLWRFGQAGAAPPSAQELAALQALVGWKRVERSGDERRSVRLSVAGMEIDLGGIGKEYAVDRGIQCLADCGAQHALLNLAGDLCALGSKPDGSSWRVGIRNPFEPSAVIAEIELSHAALATSGDYERCLMHEGRRYGHLLDARSGWPVDHWRSVSVKAPTALLAGSVSTLAMLMEAQGLTFLKESGLDFLAIDHQGMHFTRETR